ESRTNQVAEIASAVVMLFARSVATAATLLADQPLRIRRAALQASAKKYLQRNDPFALSPATTVIRITRRWYSGVGATLDGVIAKRLDMTYQSANRTGMMKIKNIRTADCVVGGFRYATGSKTAVGSLLLGLYDQKVLLNH